MVTNLQPDCRCAACSLADLGTEQDHVAACRQASVGLRVTDLQSADQPMHDQPREGLLDPQKRLWAGSKLRDRLGSVPTAGRGAGVQYQADKRWQGGTGNALPALGCDCQIENSN